MGISKGEFRSTTGEFRSMREFVSLREFVSQSSDMLFCLLSKFNQINVVRFDFPPLSHHEVDEEWNDVSLNKKDK